MKLSELMELLETYAEAVGDPEIDVVVEHPKYPTFTIQNVSWGASELLI